MIESARKRAVFDTNVFLAAHITRNPRSPTTDYCGADFPICEHIVTYDSH